MKKLLLTFLALETLFLTGCATCDSKESIPVVTVEQTAEVFNEVISRENCDIVMCHLVKTEHAACRTAIRNVVNRYDWYEVIYSVKNFLMPGDKLVIVQHIDSPLEEYTPYYQTYKNSEVVYFDIDSDSGAVNGPLTSLLDNQYYIWLMNGPHGNLLDPARIGQEHDYIPKAQEAFFKVKREYWKKHKPDMDLHWHQGSRQTPISNEKSEDEK